MKQPKTLIEQYISTPAFKRHRQKIINLLDPYQRHIDDAQQNFCIYYINRPTKAPNIRKLYNELLVIFKKEKRYVTFDLNNFLKKFDKIFNDEMLDNDFIISNNNLENN